MIRNVNIVKELGGLLLEVEKPSRYTGGEFGILANKRINADKQINAISSAHSGESENIFRTLIAFPDLYEIGMGNQALRIIYNRLNEDGIFCDRAFAPAPDFEKLLRENNIPLYGLDTGISLANLDLLMFTLGYELGLTGVLAMLDVSGIPLRCDERNNSQDYPVVIAGGPAVSNPLPYSLFIDAFWIGEAEAGFFELAQELAQLKKRGEGRAAILKHLSVHPNVWVRGKEKAKRAIAAGFSSDYFAAVFPVPSMKIVHNHGMVEIMRGCPNGCRFCHAGFWYRPMRQKNSALVLRQSQAMVMQGGWRQISLSSLSTGDYNGIGELVGILNKKFFNQYVSFQMPSLKVSSFSLLLLEKISATRKSGLTFAVETPQDAWQMAINKEVTRDSVTEILFEAKRRGWRTAKFYFMIGLPIQKTESNGLLCEEEEIVSFIMEIGRRTRMHFNINVGLFVPKPHTPYQWTAQMDSSIAAEKFNFIKFKLKPLGHKVSVSDTLISRLEGIMSRGDERAGLLVEEAYHNGSRLDAWSEFINREKWQQLLEENNEMINSFLNGGNAAGEYQLPWHEVDSCVSNEYFHKELEKSNMAQRTASCQEKCTLCGVCGKEIKLQTNESQSNTRENAVNRDILTVNSEPHCQRNDPAIYRLLFSYSKQGSAVFHGHLSLIEVFSMAFTRANLPVLYTEGFNPLARIEFASPLATGISAGSEIAAADFTEEIKAEYFIEALNMNMPEGIRIEKAVNYYIPTGTKKHSLSSLLWGFVYSNGNNYDYVIASDEKKYRQSRFENDYPGYSQKSSMFFLKRESVLARNIDIAHGNGISTDWASYFDIYKFLYQRDNT